MSYWVYLRNDAGHSVEVEPHQEGGTYQMGGCSEAELNVTYNYSREYSKHGFSLRDLEAKSADETIPELERLVGLLGAERDADYWKPTPGNAGFALSILLDWARQHPKAAWHVS